MAPDCSFRCENIAELQAIIYALLKVRTALFRRSRGDPGAVRDFIDGQVVILSVLEFLNQRPDSSDKQMTELIQEVWRRYRIGPTLGTGQACQYLLRFLRERYGSNAHLEWPGWQELKW